MNEKKPRLIQSVERAAKIIDCFDSINVQLSLSEISEMVKLNISTVHGIINTLVSCSYIDKNADNGKYRLGIKFLLKGNIVAENLELKDVGHSYIVELTKKYNMTSHLYIYRNESIYCVDKVEAPSGYFVLSSKIGNTLPLQTSASGKVILANLPQNELEQYLGAKTISDRNKLPAELEKVRKQGFSVEDEEVELGVYGMSAPVRNSKSVVIGTVSIVGPTARFRENERSIRMDLLETAGVISRHFGYSSGQLT